MLIKKKISPETNDCMVLAHYPSENDVSFYVKDFPEKKDGVETIVSSVISCGQHLCDIEGASKPEYYRNKTEEMNESVFYNLVARVNFPNGIPKDYKQLLDSYQAEDFIVEYHEESVVEV